jgi:2-succinyl-6-hydroxy-2,4-cyclohexadiene-1-carboxylate synthase
MQSRHHYVSSGGSRPLRLHVTEWCRGGAATLLVHGFGDSAAVWNDFSHRMGDGAHNFAIDLRGHGESDWDPDARYDTRFLLNDLIAVCDAIGLDRARLIGHSMGAELATRFAAAFPERAEQLILVDFGPEIDAAAAEYIYAEFASMPRRFASVDAYWEWLIEHRPFAGRWILKRFAADSLRPDNDGFVLKSDLALGRRRAFGVPDDTGTRRRATELWEALRGICCPCLVVRGAHSSVLPADVARKMADDVLPDGRLAVIQRAGHALMLDNPEEFHRAAERFLSGA